VVLIVQLGHHTGAGTALLASEGIKCIAGACLALSACSLDRRPMGTRPAEPAAVVFKEA